MLPTDFTGILEGLYKRSYPVEIGPKQSVTLYISDISHFRQQLMVIRSEQNIIGRFLFSFTKAIVLSEDGMRFRAKIRSLVPDTLAGH